MLANREIVFAIGAALFLGAGAYHLYGLVVSLADPRLAAFHAAFVVIDPATAFLLVRRPRWFPYAFAALTAQQIYSHGMEALTAWNATATIDYVSLFIIAFMPALLALTVYDAVTGKSEMS